LNEHYRLRAEQHLATARRALYRALEVAESAAAYGLEDDLQMVSVELTRIMEDVMANRKGLEATTT
jgi:hypothetical protein